MYVASGLFYIGGMDITISFQLQPTVKVNIIADFLIEPTVKVHICKGPWESFNNNDIFI